MADLQPSNDRGRFMTWVRLRKHSLMLAILLLELFVQPMATGRIVFLGTIVMVTIVLVVFERRRQRIIASLIASLGIGAAVASHVVAADQRVTWLITYHVFAMVFLAYSVVTILGQIFESKRIVFDHVIGAFSGFILAALCWGNLYIIIELFVPDSFHASPEVAWELEQEHTRRFLFNHLSFSTLLLLSSPDISPATPTARTLTWLEALFGQFYFAVFIGQIIGLKLAEATRAYEAGRE